MKHFIVALVLGAISISATAIPISITDISIESANVQDNGVFDSNSFQINTVPQSDTATVTVGTSTATASSSLSGDAMSALIASSYSGSFDNSGGADELNTSSAYFDYFFTPSTTMSYSLSGQMAMTAPATTIVFSTSLIDVMDGSVIFRDINESKRTANENFILGVIGDADYTNINAGALTGVLLAGHEYWLISKLIINNRDGFSQNQAIAATANGFVDLQLTTVPIPAAVWLFGSALGLLVWCRGRDLS